MFDFRYHALSLVAVFLALGLGIVLGATIGDSLVSEANRDLRSSLRDDVVKARRDAREAREGSERRDELIETALPELVEDLLAGDRVAVVSLGAIPDQVEASAREGIEEAGGSVDSVSELPLPEALEGVTEPEAAEARGRRLGVAIVRGGRPLRRLEGEDPGAFRGEAEGASEAVLYRQPPGEDRSPERTRLERSFADGLVRGLDSEATTVVGVERASTDPSQVSFFEDRGISSIDDVETAAGRIALALVLDGAPRARYGLKGSAERPIPEL
ncbi:MAG: copper transporter [Thermoleophilaceae bacterium]|nr:copper transporter [Thermoleophilaceae bacterium]